MKKRKLLSIGLAAALAFTSVNIAEFAGPERVMADDTTNSFYSESFFNGRQVDAGVELYGYSGFSDEVVIPAQLEGHRVTEIGEFSESDGKDFFVSVTIPEGVTKIAAGAFKNCPKLTRVNIPSSVTEIGKNAFAGCSSLTEIIVDENSTAYTSLDGVLLTKDKTKIVCYPQGKKGNYEIPLGVTAIGSDAFKGCSGLASVTIPDSVTQIDSGAFKGCSGLASVTISSGVKEIYKNAFEDCSSLTSITIPDSVTSIRSEAFKNCSSLTSITIPDSVTSIYSEAFKNCSGLTEISVDEGNTEYVSADGVLYNKSKTKLILYPEGKTGDYVIPEGVKELESDSFGNCSGLTGVKIPSSMKAFSESTFKNCSALTNFTVDEGNTNYAAEDGVLYNKDKKTLLAFPSGKGGAFVIPASVKQMYCSYGFDKVTSLTIPAGLNADSMSIPWMDCRSLEEIIVDDNNETLVSQDGILYNKAKTKIYGVLAGKREVVIPEGVTGMGPLMSKFGFRGFTALTSLTIPASFNVSGRELASCLEGCSALKSITVAENNPNCASQDGMLLNKQKDELCLVPSGMEGELCIPEGVSQISSFSGLDGCSKLTGLRIPASMHNFQNGFIKNCSSLKSIIAAENGSRFSSQDGVLMDKDKTEIVCYPQAKEGDYVIPEGIVIGSRVTGGDFDKCAFFNCTGLTGLTLPDSFYSGYSNWGGKLDLCDGCTGLKTLSLTFAKKKYFEDTFKQDPLYKDNNENFEKVLKFVLGVPDSVEIKYLEDKNEPGENNGGTNENTNNGETNVEDKNEPGENNGGTNENTNNGGTNGNSNTPSEKSVKKDTVNMSKCKIQGAVEKEYTGKSLTPNIKVTYDNKVLKKNDDYTIAYKNNTKVGTASVTVTGIGSYTGSKTLKFKINPKGTVLSNVSGAKKALKIKWKKRASQTTGYEIMYAAKKTFKGAKVLKVNKNKTTSATIKKLSAKKNYYVRIRTYKKAGKNTYYSKWSASKKAKTKK